MALLKKKVETKKVVLKKKVEEPAPAAPEIAAEKKEEIFPTITFDFTMDLRGLTNLSPEILQYQGEIMGQIAHSKKPTSFIPYDSLSLEFYKRDGRDLFKLPYAKGMPLPFWKAALPHINHAIILMEELIAKRDAKNKETKKKKLLVKRGAK